jgi:hypothetical protein
MNTVRLISQLLEIEKALDHVEPARIRGMLFEAQESVLDLEKQLIEIMTDYEALQMLLDFDRSATGSIYLESKTPSKMLVN